jgi:hypothetical protein
MFRETDQSNFDEGSADARGFRKALRVTNGEKHGVERRAPNAPDNPYAEEQPEHHAPGDRRAEPRKSVGEIGKGGTEQALEAAGDLQVRCEHGQHEREDEAGDREIEAAHPERYGANRESRAAG